MAGHARQGGRTLVKVYAGLCLLVPALAGVDVGGEAVALSNRRSSRRALLQMPSWPTWPPNPRPPWPSWPKSPPPPGTPAKPAPAPKAPAWPAWPAHPAHPGAVVGVGGDDDTGPTSSHVGHPGHPGKPPKPPPRPDKPGKPPRPPPKPVSPPPWNFGAPFSPPADAWKQYMQEVPVDVDAREVAAVGHYSAKQIAPVLVYTMLACSVLALFLCIVYFTHRRLSLGYVPPPERSSLLPRTFHHAGSYGSVPTSEGTQTKLDPVREEDLIVPLGAAWASPRLIDTAGSPRQL